MNTRRTIDAILGEDQGNYQSDLQAEERAKTLVGDGGSPNIFFVSLGNSFEDEETSSGLESNGLVVLGEYPTIEAAEEVFASVVLNGETGPRFVGIEDRQTGLVKQRYLVRTVSYREEER